MDPQRILWLASLAVEAAALATLLWRGQGSRYFWFAWFTLAGILRSAILLNFPPRTDAYFIAFAVSEPVKQILLILTTWEAYQLMLRRYAGEQIRWQVLIAIVGAAAMLAGFVAAQPAQAQPYLRILFSLREWLFWILAGSCLLMSALFRLFRAPGAQNSVRHLCLLASYLLTRAAAAWAISGAGQSAVSNWNLFSLASGAAIYALWPIALRPAGDIDPPEPTDADREAVRQEGREFLDRLDQVR